MYLRHCLSPPHGKYKWCSPAAHECHSSIFSLCSGCSDRHAYSGTGTTQQLDWPTRPAPLCLFISHAQNYTIPTAVGRRVRELCSLIRADLPLIQARQQPATSINRCTLIVTEHYHNRVNNRYVPQEIKRNITKLP